MADKRRKIILTAVLAVSVILFFVWLGVGMVNSVPEDERSGLMPMFLLYATFPILISVVSLRRIRELTKQANAGTDDTELISNEDGVEVPQDDIHDETTV